MFNFYYQLCHLLHLVSGYSRSPWLLSSEVWRSVNKTPTLPWWCFALHVINFHILFFFDFKDNDFKSLRWHSSAGETKVLIVWNRCFFGIGSRWAPTHLQYGTEGTPYTTRWHSCKHDLLNLALIMLKRTNMHICLSVIIINLEQSW